MLTVKPIQTKQEQEFFASKCNIPYDEDMMAYAAYEEEKANPAAEAVEE